MVDVSKRLEKAERFLQRGKHHDALKELLQASDEDPANDALHLKAADLSATLNRTADAVRLYSRLFDRQASTGDIGAAALTYKKIAHIETPAVGQMLRFAGLVERTSRDEALATYRAAVQQAAPEQALEAQRRVVSMEPAAREFDKLADLQARLGQAAAAAESLLGAAEHASNAGDDDAAFEYLKRSGQADPENRTARLRLAAALSRRRRFGEVVTTLEPLATGNDPDIIGLYSQALIESGRVDEAEPYIWQLYESDSNAVSLVGELMDRYVASGKVDAALGLAHRLELRESGHRRRRDFILMVKNVVMRHEPHIDLLSYLAELLNAANREQDYCDVLGRLFDIHFASGHFEKAADALERAGEVDPYDPANHRRLAALSGKLEERRFQSVATRFGKSAPLPDAEAADTAEPAVRPTLLEDLMLQAEIFLQYGMRARARERLQRISRLFPGEEANNPQLEQLYDRAAFQPSAASGGSQGQPRPTPAASRRAAGPKPQDLLTRIAEIAHNVFRQAQVDAVLFVGAHDIGRLFEAFRCVVALCSPGGPPSAYAEYCSPGVARSEIDALVDLVAAAGREVESDPARLMDDAGQSTEPVAAAASALGIGSLAIARLSVAAELSGVLIVGHPAPRVWTDQESSAISLLAQHVALASNTARLRKMLDAVAPREDRTGMLKRNAYFDTLTFEIQRSIQHRAALSLALFRVGGADTPHSATEQAARHLLPFIRQTDVAVAYDRSTIALILGDTSAKGALQAAKKLRGVLSREKATRDLEVYCGIAQAELNPAFDTADIATEVANRVEAALKQALAAGPGATRALSAPGA